MKATDVIELLGSLSRLTAAIVRALEDDDLERVDVILSSVSPSAVAQGAADIEAREKFRGD